MGSWVTTNVALGWQLHGGDDDYDTWTKMPWYREENFEDSDDNREPWLNELLAAGEPGYHAWEEKTRARFEDAYVHDVSTGLFLVHADTLRTSYDGGPVVIVDDVLRSRRALELTGFAVRTGLLRFCEGPPQLLAWATYG